ncbi:hypothetical protein G3I77_39315 [Streptomyces sp. D2-8]|uniref:hypothetical protein n=1 Tax=Streptomyces sp. D2-8 TaxID=2707767 RepID=UPI0020BF45AA|nr:hypothetical protein [Streptomyces sp. D2-8]MCK8438819.1 hypothetical protein [Streptomyces sp. D2-8]
MDEHVDRHGRVMHVWCQDHNGFSHQDPGWDHEWIRVHGTDLPEVAVWSWDG